MCINALYLTYFIKTKNNVKFIKTTFYFLLFSSIIYKYIKKGYHMSNTAEQDFKKNLDYFLNTAFEQQRLAQYQEHSQSHKCSLEQAKNEILRQTFSEYISTALKNALKITDKNNLDAFNIINQLEELKPIFKSYDVNTFSSFIATIEKNLSETSAGVLFESNFISDNFIQSLTANLIKSIANPIPKPDQATQYLRAFNNHPLLYCLQEQSEADKIIRHIEDGTIDVGQYKKLIQAVLNIKANKHNESIDFFICNLINEDISKGFYNIYSDAKYEPKIIKKLLSKIINGDEININDVHIAISQTNQNKITITQDSGELIYSNSSAGTLNDSGFFTKIGSEKYFMHLHTAQGKGENQNGQQAATTNVLNSHNIQSLSLTLTKHNAGKTDWHLDFCREYDLLLNEQEKILLSNMQFESNYLNSIYGDIDSTDLTKTNILSSNLRIVKDSVQQSSTYNNLHIGLHDAAIIKNKAQLYAGFLSKYEQQFLKLVNESDSENDTQTQIAAAPMMKAIDTLLLLEDEIGSLFTQEQATFINKWVNNTKPNSPEIKAIRKHITTQLKTEKPRDNKPADNNSFLDILNTKQNQPEIKAISQENLKAAEQIKQTLLTKHYGKHLIEILNILDTKDFKFNEGYYTSSNRPDYYIAYRMNPVNGMGDYKSDTVFSKHLEALNLLCEYAKLKGRKIHSLDRDYTNGFKP